MKLVKATGQPFSLRTEVRAYKERIEEIRLYLEEYPHEWGKFQSEFNQEINGIFRDLMLFEKEHLAQGNEGKVDKLKRLFIKRFRSDFVRGEYLKWSLEKPFGYPGDYKIIDDIYRNDPVSVGTERLYDNYFQMSAICVAVRNRKEDFKKIIRDLIQQRKRTPIKIMNLASGSCRDIYEILSDPSFKGEVIFHCYDNDEKAIHYAQRLLRDYPRIHFFKQNAVRIARMKQVKQMVESDYDLIYVTGLFDYMGYRVAVRLVSNLRKLLNKNGVLAISNVREKFSNPSIYFMEWVADWNLIYRDDDHFKQIFLRTGFSENELTTRYEQQGIMQYVIAAN